MSDIRNFEEYRRQVLDSLGEDYTVEDLRNFERWRLKVLEGLANIGVDPEVIRENVDAWLEAHPEATTTVEDGSITKAKLFTDLIAEIEGKADETDLNDLKSDLEEELDTKADAIIETASGSVASFTDGGDDLPMKSLKVEIVPKQSGSGDPSPDNVRLISGWSGVNVGQSGKNLMPLTLYDGVGYNLSVGTSVTPSLSSRTLIDNGDGTFSIAFTSTWQNGTTLQTLPPSGTLRFTATVSSTGTLGISMYLLDDSYKVLATVIGNSNPTNFTANINLADYPNARYIAVAYTNRGTADVTLTITNPQLTIGSTATAYEPYQGESKYITFKDENGDPVTVYGGEMELTDGEGESTMAMVDLGTLDWSYDANNQNFRSYSLTTIMKGGAGIRANMACSKYKTINDATYANFDKVISCMPTYTYGNLIVRDSSYTDAATFKTAMAGVQLCYELATPTPIYCEPTEIRTLKGDNNVWADTGDVEAEYRADTTLAFEKLKNAIVSLGGNI